MGGGNALAQAFRNLGGDRMEVRMLKLLIPQHWSLYILPECSSTRSGGANALDWTAIGTFSC